MNLKFALLLILLIAFAQARRVHFLGHHQEDETGNENGEEGHGNGGEEGQGNGGEEN